MLDYIYLETAGKGEQAQNLVKDHPLKLAPVMHYFDVQVDDDRKRRRLKNAFYCSNMRRSCSLRNKPQSLKVKITYLTQALGICDEVLKQRQLESGNWPDLKVPNRSFQIFHKDFQTRVANSHVKTNFSLG